MLLILYSLHILFLKAIIVHRALTWHLFWHHCRVFLLKFPIRFEFPSPQLFQTADENWQLSEGAALLELPLVVLKMTLQLGPQEKLVL